jgi:hypothetical protein
VVGGVEPDPVGDGGVEQHGRVQDGRWRLAAFQNTRVRPMGRSAGTFLVWTLGDRLWRMLRLSTNTTPTL